MALDLKNKLQEEVKLFIDALEKSKSIVIFSHRNPDGDTVGSSLALYIALKNIGKNPEIIDVEDLREELLDFIPYAKNYKKECTKNYYDMAFMCDCADRYRVDLSKDDPYCLEIFENSTYSVNIDHHESNDNYGKNFNFVDTKAVANSEVMYYLLKELEVKHPGCINYDVAFCLYCGLITDSGGLSFNSVTDSSLFVAYELKKDYNVDLSAINRHFMYEERHNVFNLKLRVLSKALFFFDNKLSFVIFKKEDFDATNTIASDTEGIVNDLRNIRGNRVAVALTEIEKDVLYKVSFRSANDINVSMVAQSCFGGGGHKNAAGCQIKDTFDNVITRIKNAFEKIL